MSKSEYLKSISQYNEIFKEGGAAAQYMNALKASSINSKVLSASIQGIVSQYNAIPKVGVLTVYPKVAQFNKIISQYAKISQTGSLKGFTELMGNIKEIYKTSNIDTSEILLPNIKEQVSEIEDYSNEEEFCEAQNIVRGIFTESNCEQELEQKLVKIKKAHPITYKFVMGIINAILSAILGVILGAIIGNILGSGGSNNTINNTIIINNYGDINKSSKSFKISSKVRTSITNNISQSVTKVK